MKKYTNKLTSGKDTWDAIKKSSLEYSRIILHEIKLILSETDSYLIILTN